MLAFAGMPELIEHLVEAAGQLSDFVAPAHLGYRLQPARGDILGGRGNHLDRARVAVGQRVGEHDTDGENHQRQRDQTHPRLTQQLCVVAEIRNHLHVAHQVILDHDRNQVNGRFTIVRNQVVGGRPARVGPGVCVDYDLLGAGIDRGSDQPGVGAVDDQVFAGSNRNLDTAVVQVTDIVLQAVAVGGAHRGEFLDADLDSAGQILDVFLLGMRDRLLRAQADHDHRAERGGQQYNDYHQQLGFET